jgi:PAS domain S-box-containing protein
MATKTQLPSRWPRLTAAALVGLAATVLVVGYGFDVEWVRRPVPAGPWMHAGTAVAILVYAAALWVVARADRSRPVRLTARGLVGAVMTLAAHSLVWRAIWIFTPTAWKPPVELIPSIPVALFLLTAGASLVIQLESHLPLARLNVAQWLAGGAAMCVLPSTAGVILAFDQPDDARHYAALAPHSGVALLALAGALFFSRSATDSVAGFLRSNTTASRVTRRLLLAGLLLPPVDGICERLVLAWGFPVRLHIGMFAGLQIVTLCALAGCVGWVLRRSEHLRDQAEKERTDAQRHVERQAALLQSEVARRTSELSRALMFNQRLALVASRTTNGVLITNVAGEIEWMNEGFTRITGYTFEDAIGRRPGEFLHGPRTDPAIVAHMRERLATGEGFDVEVINYGKDGREYWIALEVQPMRDGAGNLIGFTGIKSDITVRKLAEERLRSAKEEAEQLNGALEQAIAQAQQSAIEANLASQAKSAFLATMSHEIRTPLNGVIGMASLLRDTRLDALQLDFVRTIETSGDALLTIINDILDYSKIEAGKIELEAAAFDLRQCLEDALDLFATKAAGKQLELLCEILPGVPNAIIGDVTRLRQVVVNLVGNALKFTANGEVTVILASRVTADGRHELHFTVRDTGIGIPAERLDRLFQPFSQIDSSTTRKYGGSGLGLAISRRLAEAMGGRMWVESKVGHGSAFHFSILATEEVLPERPAWQVSPAAMSGRSMLLAVENRVVRAFLSAQLSTWGIRTADASTPAELAVRLVAPAQWDLVLVDRAFGAKDGWTSLDSFRQVRGGETVPLVLLSFPTGGALEKDFVARLIKPLKPLVIFDTLRRFFSRASNAPGGIVTVPVAPAAVETSQLRVLLVEDNLVNQRVASMLLGKLGFRVRLVANGAEAVAAFEQEPADVVLMDMEMPVMDGCEATRRIRANPVLPQPWIVALTANAMNADRLRALAAGMNDFVPKPIRMSDLAGAIERAQLGLTQRMPPAVPAAK